MTLKIKKKTVLLGGANSLTFTKTIESDQSYFNNNNYYDNFIHFYLTDYKRQLILSLILKSNTFSPE